MHPTLIESANGMGVHTYGLFILMAFSAAFLVAHGRAMRVGLHPMKLMPIYLAAAIGGMGGGRLLYAFAVDYERTMADPSSLFGASGFAVYGGLIGGALAVSAASVPMKIPFWKLADIAAPSVLIGMGIGRFGCFFAGCCHGALAPLGANATGLLSDDHFLHGQIWMSSTFPFISLEFYEGVGRLLNEPLYPTQLWASGILIGLSVLMLSLWEHRRFDGQLATLLLIIEPLFRSTIEAFRADHRGYAFSWEVSEAVATALPGMSQAGTELGTSVIGFTTSQFIGFGMVLLGGLIYIVRRNAGVAPEIPLDHDDEYEEEI
ncbi:MAG: hypothetical protein GWP91_23765 [Rhodobacterales bacterium]|nr:hypothetical protein [Rhodobacterales bacterium]